MERKDKNGPSTATRRWVAWRKAVGAAVDEDHRRADGERTERQQRIERDYDDPRAVWIGLAVVLVLAVGGWFLIDAMRCNPLFSNSGLVQSRDCR